MSLLKETHIKSSIRQELLKKKSPSPPILSYLESSFQILFLPHISAHLHFKSVRGHLLQVRLRRREAGNGKQNWGPGDEEGEWKLIWYRAKKREPD